MAGSTRSVSGELAAARFRSNCVGMRPMRALPDLSLLGDFQRIVN
ncbi:hypothetical protein [Paraburkholderia sp. DGU8]|jgi:hypothetical protein